MALQAKLESLGIAQYTRILHENGFEDWETVLDITEEDLDSLGFKRGHRRILQKEIANTRTSPPLPSPQIDFSRQSLPSSVLSPGLGTIAPDNHAKRAKRQYRWHPRADPNAPKKPKTAYVNFADHLRAESSIASLSFVDIAREVGKRWQSLPSAHKQEWENQAAQAMLVYEDQMDEYRATKKWQEYQAYLETFRKAPGKAARQRIKTTPSSSSSITSPLRSESSGPEHSPPRSFAAPALQISDRRIQEDCKVAIDTALTELARCGHGQSGDQTYTLQDLPSELLCRRVVATLMEGENAIFHVMGATAAENLINDVYRGPESPDPSRMAELCAIAAAGGVLTGKAVPSRVQQRLFYTVCALLGNDVYPIATNVRLMRIFLCLAIYFINIKYVNVRSLVAAGLTIGRALSPGTSHYEDKEDWRRVYRTLVLIECWLSQTLGTQAASLDIHTQLAVEPVQVQTSVENTIQWHAVRMSILSYDISNAIRESESISCEVFNHFAARLDAWQNQIAPEMQLSSLLASNGSSVGSQHDCALLTVHVFYLGTVLQLHGHRLIQAENATVDAQTPIDLLQHQRMCLAAAEQIAGLLRSIENKRPRATKSWLLIYWIFSACNVLLLGATQALRARATNDHDRLISYFRICLNTLQNCASDEPLAARYLDLVRPTYSAILDLRESPHGDLVRTNSNHKITINDLLASENTSSQQQKSQWQNTDQGISAIIKAISALLKDPFGKLTGTENANDPYPSPPTNVDALFWFQ